MKNKLSISILLLTIFCTSCTKNTNEFDGPSINELFSDFTVLESFSANRDSVDFASNQNVVFSASFNKVVNWTITITGNTSGAVKILSGTSRKLDQTNAVWDGSTSQFPMFKVEDCNVKLTIENVVDTFTLSEKILSRKVLDGFVVAHFETGLLAGWTKFIQSGADMDFQVKTDNLAPEGSKYLNMAGTVNWDYLIGLVDFKSTAYSGALAFPLNTNPDAVYFNCLLWGDPNTNQSIVLFQFTEDDNGNGTFESSSEDQYDLEVRVDWTGWKQVSVKYSDLTSLVNGQPSVPNGDGLKNPNKLRQISMLHLADPNLGFASSKLDLIMFTENAPMVP